MRSLLHVQALFSNSTTKVEAVEFQHAHLKYLLIEINAAADNAASAIRSVTPDFIRLKAAGSDDLVGIIITAYDGEQWSHHQIAQACRQLIVSHCSSTWFWQLVLDARATVFKASCLHSQYSLHLSRSWSLYVSCM